MLSCLMEVTQPAGGPVSQVCVKSLPWAEKGKTVVARSLLTPIPAARPHFWEDPKSHTNCQLDCEGSPAQFQFRDEDGEAQSG